MKGKEGAGRWWKALEKYKYVLLVVLVGVLLLLWPTGDETAQETAVQPAVQEDLFRLGEMEDRLEKALSQVEGAGEVTVVLTLRESPYQVLAQDADDTQEEGRTVRESTVVLASKGSGAQAPVRIQELAPGYQGALVVAQGADSPQVRLALSEAVSALTGLGTDKISICKGK